jgi:hypothetical protein
MPRIWWQRTSTTGEAALLIYMEAKTRRYRPATHAEE